MSTRRRGPLPGVFRGHTPERWTTTTAGVGVALGFLLCAPLTRAQEPKVQAEVTLAPQTIYLRTLLEEDPASVSGEFEVKATSDRDSISIRAADLKWTGSGGGGEAGGAGEETTQESEAVSGGKGAVKGETGPETQRPGRTISAAHIRFNPNNLSLKADQSIAVTVTVDDIRWPGLYKSEVHFTPGNQTTDLIVDVRLKPRLTLDQTSLALNVVNCWWAPSCWVADWFLAEDPHRDRWPIDVRSDSLGQIVVSPEARIRGKTDQLIREQFDVAPKRRWRWLDLIRGDLRDSVALGPGQETTFLFEIARARLSPGEYEGELTIAARPVGEDRWIVELPDGTLGARNETEATVATTVNVRSGVVPVLLLLLIGILGGRLNRGLSKPEVQARIELAKRVEVLDADIEDLDNARSKVAAYSALAVLKKDLDRRLVRNEQLTAAIEELETKVRAFQQLDDLAASVEERPIEAAEKTAILDLLSKARELVIRGDFEAFEPERRAIQVRLLEAPIDATRQDEGFSAAQADQRIEKQLESLRETGLEAAERQAIKPRWYENFVAFAAGSDRLSFKVQYGVIRPIMALLLLFALTLWGAQFFYAGADKATFGAAGLLDYFPVFLWGFGAEILNKRLQDLTF